MEPGMRIVEVNERRGDVLEMEAECTEAHHLQIVVAKDVDTDTPCGGLFALPPDIVQVPASWQNEDDFWGQVQDRQILRFDPPWASNVTDSASSGLALLRLGAVRDLPDLSKLQQVDHTTMEEQLARGYVQYSELCNVPFQEKMKGVAARVRERDQLDLRDPKHVVPAKKLKRLLEKTREAREERGDTQWSGKCPEYLQFSHCFHILDTVRLSFVCGGETLEEQVECSMKLFEAFKACTAEKDGLQMLRQKSGFAAGVKGAGGYADVKLLIWADVGVHDAFDKTQMPLQIVGEVQIILDAYMRVKERMHLVYEVNRGSFDHPGSSIATTTLGDMGRKSVLARSPTRGFRRSGTARLSGSR